MNIKNKISIVTACATLALVGVGYAAWTFNNSVAKEQDAGAYATSAIDAKDVTLSGNTTVFLVLDQAKPYWSVAVDTGAKPVELADGKITVTPDYEVTDQNDGASWTYTVTSAIAVDPAIAEYVDVTGFDTVSKTGVIHASVAEDIDPIDYALPALAYTASKPDTYAEYESMLTAVSGKKITFTFNCTFAEN